MSSVDIDLRPPPVDPTIFHLIGQAAFWGMLLNAKGTATSELKQHRLFLKANATLQSVVAAISSGAISFAKFEQLQRHQSAFMLLVPESDRDRITEQLARVAECVRHMREEVSNMKTLLDLCGGCPDVDQYVRELATKQQQLPTVCLSDVSQGTADFWGTKLAVVAKDVNSLAKVMKCQTFKHVLAKVVKNGNTTMQPPLVSYHQVDSFSFLCALIFRT